MSVEIGMKVRAKFDLDIPACGDHPRMIVAHQGTEGIVVARGEFGFDWRVRMQTTAKGQPFEDVLVYSNEIAPTPAEP